MEIFKTKKKLKKLLNRLKKKDQSIGFVPTMGALHQGHMSLIKRANDECVVTIASIFVNPTQFNKKEDFDNYPRTTGNDIILLEAAGCDILYLPEIDDLYKEDEKPKHYDLGKLDEILEGAFRSGHFQSVATIVHKFLKIVKPDQIFLGRKDFQQIAVIRRMIDLKELNVQVVPCETIREEDGLAMSSRNRRLSKEARAIAPEIHQSLRGIKRKIEAEPFNQLEDEAKAHLSRHDIVEVEYLKIVNRSTLETVIEFEPEVPILACIAAWYGDIRLIDNLFLN